LAAASVLEVEVRASTGADIKAVRAAVDAARQAQVRVSFSGATGPLMPRQDANATPADGG
jgi:hypothetical protein